MDQPDHPAAPPADPVTTASKLEPSDQPATDLEQARFTYWCRRFELHDHADIQRAFECTDEDPCIQCAELAGHAEPPTDYDLISAHVARLRLALFAMRQQCDNALDERDQAIAERDHARAQLQAIGRKSFWAARATPNE